MSHHDAAQNSAGPEVHVVPPRVLLGVWGALLVLTVLTVGVTYVNLGGFNLWVALAVAVVKASLVALYFMHLRYDHPFNGAIFISALAAVMLFIGIALIDTHQYEADKIPGYAPAIKQPVKK